MLTTLKKALVGIGVSNPGSVAGEECTGYETNILSVNKLFDAIRPSSGRGPETSYCPFGESNDYKE
jgi:hypothetical protein